MDGWTDGEIEKWMMEGRMHDGWMGELGNAKVEVWMNGWMDGWMDG
jgi:hypothetical protein